jgi:alpha-ketoglutarate-dependent 2,4-dichlorophenoxyacetate dioxygenase
MVSHTLKPLSPNFGVEVAGIDLNDVTGETLFPDIRALFEEHSALLFKGQAMTEETHFRLADLFGPLEDRYPEDRKPGEKMKIPSVSNVDEDGSVADEADLKTVNLKANFQWHIDSTFLPVPALVNILTAKIVPSSGGATEFASTRAGWAAMPEDLKARIRGRGMWHNASQSRKRIDAELAKWPMFHKWPPQHWKSVWTNPVNGREALYIASHVFKIDGYDEEESVALLDELVAFCTQPRFVYSHNWTVGDVMLWDQRAVMHRGTPWNYEEPRKLDSTCSSVRDSDGLADMRPATVEG